MNITVQQLIEALSKFPPDARIAAYEGEVCGVGIDNDQGRQIGFVDECTGKIEHG